MIIVIVLSFIFGPLITIWSLNTLFPALNIAYSWETWLAMVILGGMFSIKYSKN